MGFLSTSAPQLTAEKKNHSGLECKIFAIAHQAILVFSEGSLAICYKIVNTFIPSLRDGSLDRFLIMDPLSYFLFQPLLHDYPWDSAYKITLAANLKEKPMWQQQVSSIAI